MSAAVDKAEAAELDHAERVVLASLMDDRIRGDNELPPLQTDDFSNLRHQAIWSALVTVVADGKPASPLTVDAELARMGKSEAVGGAAFLAEILLDRVHSAPTVARYVEDVKAAGYRRRGLAVLSNALESARRGTDPAEAVRRAVSLLETPVANDEQRWVTPLSDFLGDGEPDGDDSEDWIIRDWVPRTASSIFGGPQKSGKTTTSLDLAISIAAGRGWLGFENCLGRRGRVLGIFLEDSERRLRTKLWEMCRGHGIDPRSLEDTLSISKKPFRLPGDERRLIADIKAWGADLVIVDNLTRVMVGDPNSTLDASAFTRAWQSVVDETGAAVMLLHHTAKQGNGREPRRPLDRLRGSGDFAALARNVVVIDPIEIDGTRVSSVEIEGNYDLRRSRLAIGYERDLADGRPEVRLRDLGDVQSLRSDARADKRREDKEEFSKREAIALAIVQRTGSVSGKKLAEQADISLSTAARVLETMREMALLEKGPGKNDGHVLTELGKLRIATGVA